MAWISCEWVSQTLKMPVESEILVPQVDDRKMIQTDEYKVMVLLHGANGDRSEWLLKSSVADMVYHQPIIVFMPSAKNSFYVNMANGYNYMDFITKEIPEYIKKHFRVSSNPKDWIVAGESMGGYGAMRCGLEAGDVYGNIASFSGTVEITDEAIRYPMFQMDLAFGEDWEQTKNSDNNLFNLYKKVVEKVAKEARPKIFLSCGTKDYLHKANVEYYNAIRDHFDVTFVEGNGMHDFTYWNQCMKQMLSWFKEKYTEEVAQ